MRVYVSEGEKKKEFMLICQIYTLLPESVWACVRVNGGVVVGGLAYQVLVSV